MMMMMMTMMMMTMMMMMMIEYKDQMKQEGQCTHNISVRRFQVATVAVEKQ
jgi:hypothetical protein